MHTYRIDDDTIIYQTNALYTTEGQIVIARRLEDGFMYFVDVSRCIYGRIEWDFIAPTSRRNEISHCGPDVHGLYMNNKYDLNVPMILVRELEELAIQHKHHVPCTR